MVAGSLAGLLGAIDEDVRAGRAAGDEEALGDGFEMKLLIERLAGFQFHGCLQRRVAVLRDLQAVMRGGEIVEAARSLAIEELAACRTEQSGGGADHVGDDVNGAFAGGGNGMGPVVALFGGGDRRVVVLNVVDHTDVCRSVAHELKKRGVLGGA